MRNLWSKTGADPYGLALSYIKNVLRNSAFSEFKMSSMDIVSVWRQGQTRDLLHVMSAQAFVCAVDCEVSFALEIYKLQSLVNTKLAFRLPTMRQLRKVLDPMSSTFDDVSEVVRDEIIFWFPKFHSASYYLPAAAYTARALGLIGVCVRRAGLGLICSRADRQGMALCHTLAVGDVSNVFGYIVLTPSPISAAAFKQALTTELGISATIEREGPMLLAFCSKPLPDFSLQYGMSVGAVAVQFVKIEEGLHLLEAPTKSKPKNRWTSNCYGDQTPEHIPVGPKHPPPQANPKGEGKPWHQPLNQASAIVSKGKAKGKGKGKDPKEGKKSRSDTSFDPVSAIKKSEKEEAARASAAAEMDISGASPSGFAPVVKTSTASKRASSRSGPYGKSESAKQEMDDDE
jgi:hypothetical protein